MKWYTGLFPFFLRKSESLSDESLFAESTTFYLYQWHVKVSKRILMQLENKNASFEAMQFSDNLVKGLEKAIEEENEIGEMPVWGQLHQ